MNAHLHTGSDAPRNVIVGVLLAMLVVFLQGCGASNQPFAKSSKPSGRTAPAITVTKMNGLPADKAQLMVKMLQESAAKRDIAIIEQDLPDAWKLTGDFVPQSEPDGTVKLVYGWTLWDTKSRSLHQVSGAEPSGPAAGNAWTAVTPDTLRRVAGFTTESLSSRMAQLGFATQIGGLMPPTHAYAQAGPNAEKELDFETLYGPQTASVTPADPQSVPGSQALATEVAVARAPVEETPKPNPRPTSKAAKTANKQSIRGVAVTGVTGSPGKGNQELAAAMRRVLKQAGWPVYKSPRPDALTISGDVDLSARSGAAQKVALAWTVKSPGGKVLGTIRQANDVPAGSLDAGWGKTADYAAQAGAEGIFDLVKKLR
ncbi:MAG: hypothetical protein HKN11_15920 [Rhizobiales bacterium]|nr:hypothetical protein [Hyphomicrobiales bacterium]